MENHAQRIAQLCIVHRPHDGTRERRDGHALPAVHGLKIATCQRELLILHHDAEAAGPHTRGDSQIMHGASAYNFLLQTVTGLNSSVPGETNVQGQFRRQWNEWRNSSTTTIHKAWTNRLMQALLDDSSAIRAQHLQGIGGNSYGSLVRKLLLPAPDERILFVGMGDLALSMRDFFRTFERAAWNRHALTQGAHPELRLFAPEHVLAAADWATQCIITTPPDAHNDGVWADAARRSNIRRTVHLGRRRNDHGPWSAAAAEERFLDLDDVFQLQSAQSNLRTQKIVQARRACTQRATALADLCVTAGRQALQPASQRA